MPYEAFLAEKPVVTTTDAGGPLEVVHDRRNGLVCEPAPARARGGAALGLARATTTRRGVGAGRPRASPSCVSWDHVIERLLG